LAPTLAPWRKVIPPLAQRYRVVAPHLLAGPTYRPTGTTWTGSSPNELALLEGDVVIKVFDWSRRRPESGFRGWSAARFGAVR
jgi:hypothetical protein